MTEPRVLIDSSIPLYALGGPSPWRDDCTGVIRAMADGQIDAYASVEMIQEALHHRLRVTGDRIESARQCSQLRSLVTLLDFDTKVLELAIDLVRSSARVRGRDAVHAATAAAHGIGLIVSTDQAFDQVPGLARMAPGQILADLSVA